MRTTSSGRRGDDDGDRRTQRDAAQRRHHGLYNCFSLMRRHAHAARAHLNSAWSRQRIDSRCTLRSSRSSAVLILLVFASVMAQTAAAHAFIDRPSRSSSSNCFVCLACPSFPVHHVLGSCARRVDRTARLARLGCARRDHSGAWTAPLRRAPSSETRLEPEACARALDRVQCRHRVRGRRSRR